MTEINTPELAARLGRAIASDIALYNSEKIAKSYANDSLFEDLKDAIEEGRELYRGRLSEAFDPTQKYYEHALVDVIYAKAGRPKTVQ